MKPKEVCALDGGRLIEDLVVEAPEAVTGVHGLEEAKELLEKLRGWIGVAGV